MFKKIVVIKCTEHQGFLRIAARLFLKGISLGGGRSRGYLASSDKKLAFMDKGKTFRD